jgi:hypothetical protein
MSYLNSTPTSKADMRGVSRNTESTSTAAFRDLPLHIGVSGAQSMSAANHPLLSTIDSPDDLRRLSPEWLKQVTAELRRYLIDTVSQKGGHFAAAPAPWSWRSRCTMSIRRHMTGSCGMSVIRRIRTKY